MPLKVVIPVFTALTVALLYLVGVFVRARSSVAAAPRKPMFICDTHGALPESALLTLFDGDMEYESDGKSVRGPIRSCPICFENKVKEAKKK